MRSKVFFCLWMGGLLLTGCRYHFQEPMISDHPTTISVLPIAGDDKDYLNAALVRELAKVPHLEYRQRGGVLQLQVAMVDDDHHRIGYRYDYSPYTGHRRKNIVGIENRRELTVAVKLIDTATDEVLLGPIRVQGTAEYDYIDPDSVRDLTFTNSSGQTQTVINFSLGQLDSAEGAHDDAGVVIYEQLAKTIVSGVLTQLSPFYR